MAKPVEELVAGWLIHRLDGVDVSRFLEGHSDEETERLAAEIRVPH